MSRRQKFTKNVQWADFLESAETTWQQDREAANAAVAKRLQPKTAGQELYFEAVVNATVTLCTGPAGSGKSYVAVGLAAEQLKSGKIKRVIITRPLVACGQGYGFRPGTVLEKILPTMRPLLDAFEDFYSPKEVDRLIESKTIDLVPLEDMRGLSIREAWIICDEAQNATYQQLHMCLTRFGEGSKVIVTGDPTSSQTDLRSYGPNPFSEVIRKLEGLDGISVVRLTRKDICRHGLTGKIDARLSDVVYDDEDHEELPCYWKPSGIGRMGSGC